MTRRDNKEMIGLLKNVEIVLNEYAHMNIIDFESQFDIVLLHDFGVFEVGFYNKALNKEKTGIITVPLSQINDGMEMSISDAQQATGFILDLLIGLIDACLDQENIQYISELILDSSEFDGNTLDSTRDRLEVLFGLVLGDIMKGHDRKWVAQAFVTILAYILKDITLDNSGVQKIKSSVVENLRHTKERVNPADDFSDHSSQDDKERLKLYLRMNLKQYDIIRLSPTPPLEESSLVKIPNYMGLELTSISRYRYVVVSNSDCLNNGFVLALPVVGSARMKDATGKRYQPSITIPDIYKTADNSIADGFVDFRVLQSLNSLYIDSKMTKNLRGNELGLADSDKKSLEQKIFASMGLKNKNFKPVGLKQELLSTGQRCVDTFEIKDNQGNELLGKIPLIFIEPDSYERPHSDEDSDKWKMKKDGYTTLVRTKALAVSETKISCSLYDLIIGMDNPSYPQNLNDYNEVTNISYLDAVNFCNRLSIYLGLQPMYLFSQHSSVDGSFLHNFWSLSSAIGNEAISVYMPTPFGLGYRLLSETEWEYIALAGDTSYTSVSYNSNDIFLAKPLHLSYVGHNTVDIYSGTPNRWGFYGLDNDNFEFCCDFAYTKAFAKTTMGSDVLHHWQHLYPKAYLDKDFYDQKTQSPSRILKGRLKDVNSSIDHDQFKRSSTKELSISQNVGFRIGRLIGGSS